MEIIGEGLKALGGACTAWAVAYIFIYGIGCLCKTFLIYNDKATPENLKDWYKFFRDRKGGI